MSKTPPPVKGTQSLLGEEADRFAAVIDTFDHVRKLFGFRRVEVPTLEHTEVFSRTIGETTDVVSKEMYSFQTKGEKSVTLRPEFTAGICRAYLSEGWQQFAPLKLATHGSAFRYEQPQKGRYREFHQLDAEIIGVAEPQADVEILSFGARLLAELRISAVTLKLNTLGDSDSRGAWHAKLVEYFEGHRASLSEDSRNRLRQNPLRILDSKDERDRAIASNAPIIDDYLTAKAEDFFCRVLEGLDAAGVGYEVDPHLVRGLDYYRHTSFEFVTDRLGSQGAIIAGGRYDGLMQSLGGPHTPAIGWAAGIERLSMLIEAPDPERPTLAIVVESDDLDHLYYLLAAAVRQDGVSCDVVATGSVRKRFDRAKKLDPEWLLIINDNALTPTVMANARLKEWRPSSETRVHFAERVTQIVSRHYIIDSLLHRFEPGLEVGLRAKSTQ